ncbi:MAG: tetratricopeptide repeat protein [Acidobacteria bacterium]|nr:tetratricopeptide repeat protein [Acidobacteriota bacterium]
MGAAGGGAGAEGEPAAAGGGPGAAAPAGRAVRVAGVLAAFAFFALVGALCLTRITDTDLWWHLASGDLILRTGTVPRADPFSYTVPGQRWIDIHWLFQAALAGIHARGGLRALTAVAAALVLALFAILYVRGRRLAGNSAVLGVLVVAGLACQERFLTRPEVVSWILLAIVLSALDRALAAGTRRERRRILWIALPAVHVVWANVQGLFMLGPALLSLALVAAAAEHWRSPEARRDPDRPIDLLVALAAAALASLVNPYGAAALRLPLEQFFGHLGGVSLVSRTIAEFQPTLSSRPVTASIVAFWILVFLAALALLLNAGRVRLFEVLVAGAALYAALRARRNIPIFAIAVTPLLLRNAAGAAAAWRTARWPAARRRAAALVPVFLAALCLFLTFDVVSNRFFLRPPTERWWGIGTIPHYFPEEAARFVTESRIPGNVFHSLSIGGYLIHAWGGGRGVFIDGRNDPYVGGILETYLKAVTDAEAFEGAVRRYQITAVLWPHQRALEGRALLSYLARGNGWTLAHLDAGGAVYLRADIVSARQAAEAPFRPGRDRREVYEDLARELRASPFGGPPIREIALGEFFRVTEDPRGAEFFYGRALERLPRNPWLLHHHAQSLESQGRIGEARASNDRALAADPEYLPAVGARGSFLLEDGDLEEAARLIDRAYRGGERGARLLLARARLFDRQGRTREAVAAYQEALRRSPRDAAALLELGRLYARHGEEAAALSFFTSAAEADRDDPEAAREMAELLEKLGRAAAALDVAREAGRRTLDRMEKERATGDGTSGGPLPAAREADRRLLLLAARLEVRSGAPERAALWLEALSRAGLLKEEDLRDDPELRALGTIPER